MSKHKKLGKIGVGIVAFEGTEHLYNIISEMRRPKTCPDDNYDLVDTVIICLQEYGYDDKRKLSNIDLNECIRLRDEDHLVDEIVFANLDSTKKAREQETDKRNFIIDRLKNDYGCDYALIMDSDEYYTHASFDRACQAISDNDYQVTYCQYCNYFGVDNPEFKEYSYRMIMKYPFKEMYVPFLIKTDYKFKFESRDFDRPSDPTRRVSLPIKEYKTETDKKTGKIVKKPVFAVNYTILPWNLCKMHHLSWLRADIRKKLESWSSKKLFKDYEDLIDKAVYNFKHFDPRQPVSKAIMLFTTPGNTIDVYPMDKAYISPKCDYRTRLRPAKDYKKILVLSMSADMEPFNTLEQISNETWRNIDKQKYPNIDVDFWTYTDAKPGKDTSVDMNKHIIYIKQDEAGQSVMTTYSKTVEAFNIVVNKLHLEFDYLLRTNNSTWINIPLINEILAYTHDDSLIYAGTLFSAFWSAFNIYGIGNLLLFSKRQMNIIMNICGSVEHAKKQERRSPSMDDNLIFAGLNNRCIRLGIPYRDIYHSIGCRYYPYMKVATDSIDFTYPGHQVKSIPHILSQNVDRISLDSAKMREIDRQWREYDIPIEVLYDEWKEKNYDKTISVIMENKEEYFKLTEQVANLKRYEDEISYPREEMLEYLPKRQKATGYQSGLF